MRYNSRELAQLAIQQPKYFTKEGSLFMKESSSSLKNDFFGRKKNDVYVERWCRIRSNMMFYFKGKDMLSDPYGVIILERSSIIEASEESQSFAFIIVFPKDDKFHYLAAHTMEQRDEWMAALQQATYEGLREHFYHLRRALTARTGRDPMSDENIGQISGVPPPAINDSDYHAEEPVLEMSVACSDLPNDLDGQPPTTFVAISIMTPPHQTSWIRCAQTEIIQKNSNPDYLTTVSFSNPRDITMVTRFKGTVYDVRDRAHGKIVQIGQTVCTMREIVAAAGNRLTLPLTTYGGFQEQGTLTLLLWEARSSDDENVKGASSSFPGFQSRKSAFKRRANSISRDSVLKSVFVNPATKSYRPTVEKEPLCVQENMAECVFSFSVPQLMLELFMQEDRERNNILCQLGELKDPYENMRKDILDERIKRLDIYLEAVEALKSQSGTHFKRSCDKADKATEFAPLNLHLQRMRVTTSSKKDEFYDFITVGAFTAYAMKYKSGGLKKMLHNSFKDNNASAQPSITTLLLKIETLERNLNLLKTKTEWYANQIKAFIKQNARTSVIDPFPTFSEKKTHFNSLDEQRAYVYPYCVLEKIVELISLCESPTIKEAETELQESEEKVHNITLKSKPSMSTMEQMSIEMKQNLVKLGELHNNSAADERSWQNDVVSTVEALTGQVTKLCQHASNCLALTQIIEGHQYRTMLSSIQYRRDVVLSQALTSVIAGIYTKLATHGKDLSFQHQISHIGILLQFESLLSTYGDEMGMLEDMIVAVDDLNDVTIRLTCSGDDSRQLPTMTGHRSHIIVDIPVPASLFSKLPSEIQRGQQIKLCPVLFTMGINEQATLAERFGDTSLQDQVNRENVYEMRNYWDKFMKLSKRKSTGEVSKTDSLEVLLTRLQEAVGSKKPKNVDILQLASQLTHEMYGIRFTSCKSAKDRTAMSVTLEQCMILQRQYWLDARTFSHLLDTMRSEGTRRTNTMKNLGIRKYAFNSLQIMALPKLYRPPDGTYGKTQT
ncbi:inositol polyphosphate-4-phosphatase type I A-like isoform X2 [Ptychodera flava]|uniref:inositol polyphosphate-4-phosphatase type I A-like isoform X2 n=1 Tax=Ptychodera flava TaxID=63121 RepID=UPI00396A3FA4